MEKVELYRKYRPESLDDMVGNEKTIKELENGSHVFLMTGPAGCGKTTLARIMAKKVNAGPLSIHEINSAENRGIDTAREIMEQMRFNPSDGDSIVWILDEMHMITSAGQNALLKALEDTPEHCYFFLCTTNPEKLIAPLKTRCSIINVVPLKDEEMIYLLKRTARAEKIKIDSEVYERICEIAQGGSRKALKLLAKVLYLDSDEERLEVLKNEDSSESKEVKELCQLLMSGKANWSSISKVLKNIDMTEAERVRQAIMGYMGAVLLNGKSSAPIVSAMQAFSSADTYKNGKSAIIVACLDYLDLLSEPEDD